MDFKKWDMNWLPPELDSQNFWGTVCDYETQMLIGPLPWFIEFYLPYCPHCQKLAPTWDEFYRQNRDEINVARVDCTSEHGRPVCEWFKVLRTPTLHYFPTGSNTYHTYPGHGERTIEAFESWVYDGTWMETDAHEII